VSAAVAVSSAPGHTVLAFDFGEKYLGVAVGDTETRIAHPLAMIQADGSQKRLSEIDVFLSEWRPQRLLVGMPLALSGETHALTARARRFARQLAARYRLPVEFADERLSSAAAEQVLRERGRGGRKNKHLVHALAAKLILQAYLDESARR
jgi:putative Holliday junction resolvase